jgi:hypothetical protein
MKRRNRPRTGFTSRLERLEDRTMFDCSIAVSGGVMTIEGDGDNDYVSISDNGDGDLSVWCTGAWPTVASDVHRIDINTRGGADDVMYTQRGNRTRSMDLNVQMGDGKDEFRGQIFGDINYLRTLDIEVRGEDGGDEIHVDAASDVDVGLYAVLALNLRGGSGQDVIVANYRGEVDGTIRLAERGGLDGDYLFAQVLADAGSTGRLRGYDTEQALLEGNELSDALGFFVYKDHRDPFAIAAKVDGGDFADRWPFGDGDRCAITENVDYEDCESVTVYVS